MRRPPPGAPGSTTIEVRVATDVFVLGAGFSHAVSELMPLTDPLGESLRNALVGGGWEHWLPKSRFAGGYFEQWLSRLAEDQPDYDDATNASNRGLFETISSVIHISLSRCQKETLGSGPCPPWLTTLVAEFHRRKNTVITFNYDNLIEYAVLGSELMDHHPPKGERVRPHDILGDLPPPPPHPSRLAGPLTESFRLLKLHGSLNWYWSPGDLTGATLNTWNLAGGFGSWEQQDEDERRRRLPGRVPFIVPPTATKSAYYRNPVTKELWQRAASALQRPRRIVLMGYSLPLTDLVFTSILRENLPPDLEGLGAARFCIVNLETEPVKEVLFKLGYQPSNIESEHEGPDCIKNFALSYPEDVPSPPPID